MTKTTDTFKPRAEMVWHKKGKGKLYQVEYAPGVFTNIYAINAKDAINQVTKPSIMSRVI